MAQLSENWRPGLWATLCIIVGVGAWLRFHHLAANSLWLDEAVSWYQSKDGLADLITRVARDNYPPLHNLFLHASIELFGDAEWSLRLPSAIFGTANVLVIYWLGSMTVGRIGGLLAAGFLALSGFHIWYSQEARMYALLSLAATLFAASSFFFVKSPTILRAALVTLTGVTLLYSHPFGTLYWIAIVMGIGLFTLTAPVTPRRTIATWVAANVVAAAAFAPWAWLLLRRAEHITRHGFWIPYPSPERVYDVLTDMVGGQNMAALLFAGVLLALVPTRYAVGADEPRVKTTIAVFLVWAVLPIGLALLISFVSTPIFYLRYLIGSLPPLLLAGAYGLSRFARNWVALGFVAILSVVILTTSNLRWDYREDWREVSTMLAERLRPSDCVLIYRRYMIRPFHYYYRKDLPCLVRLKSKTDPRLQSISGNRLFVVVSHASRTEIDQILAMLRSDLWLARQEFTFRGINVTEFVKAE